MPTASWATLGRPTCCYSFERYQKPWSADTSVRLTWRCGRQKPGRAYIGPAGGRPPLCGGEGALLPEQEVRQREGDVLLQHAEPLQKVVGEGVQVHDGADLFAAPHGHLPQVPVAPAGMDAFANHADPVLRLAVITSHSRPPDRFPLSVRGARQTGINAGLGFRGWTEHFDPLAMCPLDVAGVAKPAIDDVTLREAARVVVQLLQHRLHEAAIRAVIADIDGDDDLRAGRTRHLHVIGRAEAGVGHLHHARISVRGGGARLLRLLAIAAFFFEFLALALDLGKRRLCCLQALDALA